MSPWFVTVSTTRNALPCEAVAGGLLTVLRKSARVTWTVAAEARQLLASLFSPTAPRSSAHASTW
jgi:hypothetical protein